MELIWTLGRHSKLALNKGNFLCLGAARLTRKMHFHSLQQILKFHSSVNFPLENEEITDLNCHGRCKFHVFTFI